MTTTTQNTPSTIPDDISDEELTSMIDEDIKNLSAFNESAKKKNDELFAKLGGEDSSEDENENPKDLEEDNKFMKDAEDELGDGLNKAILDLASDAKDLEDDDSIE